MRALTGEGHMSDRERAAASDMSGREDYKEHQLVDGNGERRLLSIELIRPVH